MRTCVIREAGYNEALLGLALSYHDPQDPLEIWWDKDRQTRAQALARKLAHRQGGHNKFLESIVVWLDVQASRAWWSEMDTYRVGTTKQSESTMHTLAKRAPTITDFEEGTPAGVIAEFTRAWQAHRGDVTALKMSLPEGFLQRRVVCTNYKVLQNIVAQREGHRLKWWGVFIEETLAQVQHPEFIK